MIKDRCLIINESSTALEFSSFGKDKSGKYRGLAMHDDTVLSSLNTGRLYEDSFYELILEEIMEKMEDTPVKRLMNKLLELAEEVSDVNDEEFNALYTEEPTPNENIDINKIFEQGYQGLNRYNFPR
jgi:hypothetical protein